MISVGPISYSTVNATELRAWIQAQRSPERALLEELPHCLPPHGDLVSSQDIPEAQSRSGILPPGEIHLSRGDNWLLPPGPLRYAVVIGNPSEPPIGLLPDEVEKKYCWRDHHFTVDNSTPPLSLTLRPRCHSILLADLDAWVLIYCDPADCTSENAQRAVAKAIAGDPEILDFVRRSSSAAMPRGPYLVIIQ